jgi:hypothetical protein
MNAIDPETGVEWCEENCGKVSCYDCWVRFFKIIAEAEKEQLEYGTDERSQSGRRTGYQGALQDYKLWEICSRGNNV